MWQRERQKWKWVIPHGTVGGWVGGWVAENLTRVEMGIHHVAVEMGIHHVAAAHKEKAEVEMGYSSVEMGYSS